MSEIKSSTQNTGRSISKFIVPIIILSQFLCTSLWFAGNGVMEELITNFNLNNRALSNLTSCVQLGFIIGTLVFALFTIADRYSPSKVFMFSALFATAFNLGIIWNGNSYESILLLRFLTGFFLAGIYPVGMKIAADYFESGLGKYLSFLVGALVLGTGFPHLLKSISFVPSWKSVLIITSILAIVGGLLMNVLVPDGPYRKPSQKFQFSAFFKVFINHKLRKAAFGYFGHMWELYAFWTFVPVFLKIYSYKHPECDITISIYSFIIIAIGGIACVIGGYLSEKIGTKRTAFYSLLLSCGCCLILPFLIRIDSFFLFISFMLFWGMVVIADSPLFSALIAQNAPKELKGTALTIVNCIGFSITIISIQLIANLQQSQDSNYVYMLLALGPLVGLIFLSIPTKEMLSS